MSTLGTFSEYANFARGKKKETSGQTAIQYQAGETDLKRPAIYREGATNVPQPIYKKGNTDVPRPQYKPGETDIKKPSTLANMPYKSKQRMKGSRLEKLRGIKNRNLMIGGGLAGLGVLGAGLGVAGLASGGNKNRRSEMAGQLNIASFVSEDKKKAVKAMTQTGNADADAAIKLVRDESRKQRQKEIGKLKAQRGFESAADRGNTYKNAKGGEYIARTLAVAGSPERALIAQGKRSQNGFVKGLAEGAENFGTLGYKQGATGLRKVGNAIVGRTGTGKIARLGAAGAALGTIGAVMRNKREQ